MTIQCPIHGWCEAISKMEERIIICEKCDESGRKATHQN